jgi:hypothetical protein
METVLVIRAEEASSGHWRRNISKRIETDECVKFSKYRIAFLQNFDNQARYSLQHSYILRRIVIAKHLLLHGLGQLNKASRESAEIGENSRKLSSIQA